MVKSPKVQTYFQDSNFYLIIIVLTSFFLNFWNINIEAYSNIYYSVTVKSMLTSFHNWFYASYDPAGFITVDKPPLAFWIQSLFVLIFGFHGWSIILPSALAGSITVYLTYKIVRIHFGETESLLAALFAATTPILVAVSRNNTPDAILMAFTVSAVYFLLRGIESNRFKYLVISMIFVALGFNTKTLMAFTILPAIYVTYLFYAKSCSVKMRLLRLAASSILMFTVSFAWVAIVDKTPETERPFVGGSLNNREAELLIGFNGIARVLPQHILEKSKKRRGQARPGPTVLNDLSFFDFEMGSPGFLRLFNNRLIDQINWHFPFLIFGLLITVFSASRSKDKRTHLLQVLSVLWILPCAIIMSTTVLSHRYYLSFIAPPVAILAAVGLVSLYRLFENKTKGYLLPLAFICNFVYFIFLIPVYQEPFTLLLRISAGVGLISAIFLLATHFFPIKLGRQLSRSVIVTATVVLIAPPFIWSLTPSLYSTHENLPYASPSLQRPKSEQMTPDQKYFYNGMKRHRAYAQKSLLKYLKEHNHGETFLAAVPNSLIASPMMLESSLPVMAMGGFVGRDIILSEKDLTALVESNKVSHFVMAEPFKLLPEVESWIKTNCIEVDAAKWRPKISEHINAQRIGDLFGDDFGQLMTKALTVYRYDRSRPKTVNSSIAAESKDEGNSAQNIPN